MKRLIVFDFDKTLIDTEDHIKGKEKWEKVKGIKYPYKGWWGRIESLDTDVFDYKPYPNVLKILESEYGKKDTKVVILTSRQEKLRSGIEKILELNNIKVDDVILKKGSKDKGDVILDLINDQNDIEEIIIYDDYQNMKKDKVKEFTDIEDKLPQNIKYVLNYVDDGKISLLEYQDSIIKIINEELRNII